MEIRQRNLLLCSAALLAGIFVAYSNHFENAFHFDDSNTILENPAIRSLDIGRFFSDARTFSPNPSNQSYRPLLTTSLAIDYMLGGNSLDPLWFHISTFVWFLVQLALMYILYMYVLEYTRPGAPHNWWVAWFAVAIYAMHPVSAETVNYIIQRGDLYAALGIVAAVVIYAWKPDLRRYGLFLAPALAGMLTKPTGLIFAPMLLAYIFLIDRFDSGKSETRLERKRAKREAQVSRQDRKKNRNGGSQPAAMTDWRTLPRWWQNSEFLMVCARRSALAFVVCGVFSYFEKLMTPPTFIATQMPLFEYWITQPYVTFRYFRSFFLPLHLNVDSDLKAFHSLANATALGGIAFCILLLAAAVWTVRLPEWRPVSFGLWWFLIGLVPTAIYPLNEVENDHRMFLPFVGLSLAVVCAAANLVRRFATAPWQSGLAWAAVAVLPVLGWGTHVRNQVWHTEEALWRDDIQKSPKNPRAYRGYAYAIWELPGRLPEAIENYRAALRIDPGYADAHNNLGVALAKTGNLPDAVAQYKAALQIAPTYPDAHNNLGVALAQMPGHLPEAMNEFREALRLKPVYADPHVNLGIALSQIPGRMPEAVAEFEAAYQIRPDPRLREVLDKLRRPRGAS